jgi:uncharacterized membrane protein YhhN
LWVLSPALFFAVCDWVAVAAGKKKLEYVFKPLTMVALIAVVYVVISRELGLEMWFGSNIGWWILAALVFSLLGDIFLMLPSDRFVYGLAAFLVAHTCYIAAFWPSIEYPKTYVAGAAVALVSVVLFVRIRRGIMEKGHKRLVIPVALYVLAISAMVTLVVGHVFVDYGVPFEGFRGVKLLDDSRFPYRAAAAGAILFYISDAMIGWSRFVNDFKNSRLAIMVTYHLGQMGFVVYLLRA